jgi:hypothetical protein
MTELFPSKLFTEIKDRLPESIRDICINYMCSQQFKSSMCCAAPEFQTRLADIKVASFIMCHDGADIDLEIMQKLMSYMRA